MGDCDVCAWRERFRNRISAILHKTAGEATAVSDVVGKCSDWKMAFVKVKGGWVVIAAGEWIVEK